MGIAQLIGTLLGFLIGLSACAVTAYLLIRRIGWSKLEPIVRLEFADSALSFVESARAFRPQECRSECESSADTSASAPSPGESGQVTAVADFADQLLPFVPPGQTYDEQQKEMAKQQREREQEILKVVLADNLALYQRISGLTPAA
jgi:hypothetical protein